MDKKYSLKTLTDIAKNADYRFTAGEMSMYSSLYACLKIGLNKKQTDEFFEYCNDYLKMVMDAHPVKTKGVKNGRKRTV